MPRSRTSALKSKARAAFLEALTDGATVRDAALAADLPRGTAYRWRAKDAEFAEAWDAAYVAGADALVSEATRRAVKGVEEPVYYLGKPVGRKATYSDTLLMFLLKARDPEAFCDRARAAKLEADRAKKAAETADDLPRLREEARAALAALDKAAAAKAATA